MVNTGQPSKGCQTCRTRRIKCDEQRPICGNCIKSNRECGGWRGEGGFVFQQQNIPGTRRKSRKRSASKPAEGEEVPYRVTRTRSDPSTWQLPAIHVTSPPAFTRTIPDCVETQAMCYFIAESTLIPHQLRLESNFVNGILVPIYTDARAESPLISIMAALSLRALSHRPGREQLLVESDRYYGQAVSRLNVALADPLESRSDSTLLAVLLLLMRETLAMTEHSVLTWRQHVLGAIEIVKLRGPLNVTNDRVSHRLFTAVRDHMIACHMGMCKAIPQHEIDNLWKLKLPCVGPYRDVAPLMELALEIPALRERGLRILHEPMTPEIAAQIVDLIASIKQLDARLSAWRFTLPSRWGYKTVYKHITALEDPADDTIWPGNVDVYTDRWAAYAWNMFRILRITIHMLAFNSLERLVPPATLPLNADFQTSVKTARRMADEICASIPFISLSGPGGVPEYWNSAGSPPHPYPYPHPYPHDDDYNYKTSADRSSSDDTANPRFRPDPGFYQPLSVNIGGVPLAWHVHVVSTTICLPDVQRRWARNHLERLAKMHGLDQAKVLNMRWEIKEGNNEGGRQKTVTDLAPLPYEAWEDEDPLGLGVDTALF